MGVVVIPRVAPALSPVERVKRDAELGRYDDALGAIDIERLEAAIDLALHVENRGAPPPPRVALPAAYR